MIVRRPGRQARRHPEADRRSTSSPSRRIDGAPPLRVQLSPTGASTSTLARLKELLLEFPGESQVFVHLGEHQVLRLPEQYTVEVGSARSCRSSACCSADAVLP